MPAARTVLLHQELGKGESEAEDDVYNVPSAVLNLVRVFKSANFYFGMFVAADKDTSYFILSCPIKKLWSSANCWWQTKLHLRVNTNIGTDNKDYN